MIPSRPRLALMTVLLGFVALILQGGVLRQIMPGSVVPDLILVMVVFIGFYEVSVLGAVLAFSLGLLFDLSSGLLVGPRAGASVVVFGFLSALSQRIFVESALTTALAVFCSSIVSHIVYVILVFEFKQDETAVWLSLVSVKVLIEGLFSALLAIVLVPMLRRILLGPVKVPGAGRLGVVR